MEDKREERREGPRRPTHPPKLRPPSWVDLFLGGPNVEKVSDESSLTLEEQAQILDEEVYGEPLQLHGEPSLGTKETPPRTDTTRDYDPGGWTKQGEDKPIGGEPETGGS